jgi:hypothetical protein
MRLKTMGALVVVLAGATVVAAQTRTSGTLQCKPEVQQAVPAGDQPDHQFTVQKVSCTWTRPLEIGGAQGKDGTSSGINEVTGSTAKGHGQHVTTMSTGEKAFVRFEGTTTMKAGALESASGTWHYTGGTGKLAGIKGKGTYKGKPGPDGTIVYEVEGDYVLPQR